jgi:hypothetical protein
MSTSSLIVRESHHNVHLLLDFTQHRVVLDGHPLQDMAGRAVNRLRSSDNVDMCKTAYKWIGMDPSRGLSGRALAQVTLDLNCVLID